MAAAIYPKAKEQMLQGGINLSSGVVKAILVDNGVYTYADNHEFRSSLSGTGGVAQTLASKTFTNGTFDAADITFPAVAGTVSYEALVLYLDTGNAATDRLIAYLDTFAPITSNGGDINVTWNASGIFTL